MQAIYVKRLGATNKLPARFKLSCTGGTKTYSQGHFNDTSDMLDMVGAVKSFIRDERKWKVNDMTLAWGQLKNGDWVFTISDPKTAANTEIL